MIIWVASYPKSGNTWIRAFINQVYLGKDFDLNKLGRVVEQFPRKSHYVNLIQNYNDINSIVDNSVKAQEKIIEDKKIKFLKTHSLFYKLENGHVFSNKKNTLGAIYIVRDPRNVFLSFQNHFSTNTLEMKKIFFNKLMWVGHEFKGDEDLNKDFSIKTLIGNWQNNLNSWKKLTNNLLLIKYEDLIKDPIKEFIKITNYLKKFTKLDLDEEGVINIVQKINFENLKKIEKQNGFAEASRNQKKEVINFFSSGPERNWQNTLDEETVREIEEKFYKEMKELNYI